MPGRRIRAQPELRCGCWLPWLGEQPDHMLITEVAGSHVSMVSHPAAAIEAILAAVAAISD
jgi:hypothetical protein